MRKIPHIFVVFSENLNFNLKEKKMPHRRFFKYLQQAEQGVKKQVYFRMFFCKALIIEMVFCYQNPHKST